MKLLHKLYKIFERPHPCTFVLDVDWASDTDAYLLGVFLQWCTAEGFTEAKVEWGLHDAKVTINVTSEDNLAKLVMLAMFINEDPSVIGIDVTPIRHYEDGFEVEKGE